MTASSARLSPIELLVLVLRVTIEAGIVAGLTYCRYRAPGSTLHEGWRFGVGSPLVGFEISGADQLPPGQALTRKLSVSRRSPPDLHSSRAPAITSTDHVAVGVTLRCFSVSYRHAGLCDLRHPARTATCRSAGISTGRTDQHARKEAENDRRRQRSGEAGSFHPQRFGQVLSPLPRATLRYKHFGSRRCLPGPRWRDGSVRESTVDLLTPMRGLQVPRHATRGRPVGAQPAIGRRRARCASVVEPRCPTPPVSPRPRTARRAARSPTPPAVEDGGEHTCFDGVDAALPTTDHSPFASRPVRPSSTSTPSRHDPSSRNPAGP